MRSRLREKIERMLRLDRAVRLVWQSSPRWALANVALVVVRGLLPLGALYLLKQIIDSVEAAVGAANRADALAEVTFWIVLAGALSLLDAFSRSLSRLVSEAQTLCVLDHVHHLLHLKSVAVDLAYYDDARYHDTLHRAQQEAPYRPTSIVNGLLSLAQSGISLLAIVALLVTFHWALAAGLFVATLPGLYVRIRFAERIFRWKKRRTPLERSAVYFHWMLTRDWHAKEIRLFQLARHFMARYRELLATLRKEQLRLESRRAVAEGGTQIFVVLAVFTSYAFIARQTVAGEISLGALVMYFQAFQRGQGFFQEAMTSLAGLYEDSLFLSHLDAFLDLEPKIVDPPDPLPFPRPIADAIRFEGVSFRYPSGTRQALARIDLTIRAGEVVALVGENGSGKTTLVKLLCRLYDPAEGRITIDGIDLRSFALEELRSEVSVIFQDFARYNLPVRENIGFGDIEHALNGGAEAAGRIRQAALRAGAHETIAALPAGYDTLLGTWFAEGEQLSQGEWQRMALARAFLRQAQIIILDEPTSAMDARAEYELFEKFRELAAGKTAILISHRLATVRMADQIYVIEHGTIVEAGTHDELIGRRARYADLFERQARNYR